MFLIMLPATTSAMAESFSWKTANVIEVPARHVRMSRPNDRWRVVESSDYGVLDMIYHRHGQNVVISVKTWPHFKYIPPRSYFKKRHRNRDRLKNHLLEPLIQEGFKFIEFERKDRRAFALGTNLRRQIIMLEFLFEENGRALKNPIVVEMIVDRGLYPDFKKAFRAVAGSLAYY